MLADPVKEITSHIGSLVSESFFDIVHHIFNAETVTELIESGKGLLDHLCFFLSELDYHIKKLRFSCSMKVFPETLGHDCCYFKSPDNHIHIAVVDKSPDEFGDVPSFRVG